MNPENLLAEWSRLFVESLADAGVREVIVSPGSRSTPLVCAVLDCPRLRARYIVDERSAAFHALGRAAITGAPAAVLCTSGSAAANYFPAVVEASLSHTPLILLTADRPFELHDAGASQTIDQTKLFGGYVRRFVDLGMADPSPLALAAVRRRAAQAVHDAVFPEPGPVHVNVRARKPLEPAAPRTESARDLRARVSAMLAVPCPVPAVPRRVPLDAAVARIADDCAAATSGLVVCGPSPASSRRHGDVLLRVARAAGFPVYAEATSQHRFAAPGAAEDLVADAFGWLLRTPAFAPVRPEVVLQIGTPPVAGGWEPWLGGAAVARHVIADHGFPDPTSDARSLVVADVGETLSALAAALESRPAAASRTRAFRERVARANAAAWSAVDAAIAAETELGEGAAVRAVVRGLPRGAVLAVGNSLPVRHLDAFCRARDLDVTVVSQRGASGIDGVVSRAAGAAAAAERPTVLVVGDVSALHDLAGLQCAGAVLSPFVVVVLNNDGGRIFEQLPLADTDIDEARLRFWTTPHGRSFEHAARLFDVPYAQATSTAELERAMEPALGRGGPTLVEVRVPPGAARAQARDLAARVDAAVRAAEHGAPG